MPTKLDFKAQEGSTFGIKAEFFEKSSDSSNPSPVVPNEGLTWSLQDEDGNVINERASVPLVSSQSVFIVLKGDDLVLNGNYPVTRHVLIEGTYDSLLGANLPLKIETSFQIENLVGV